MSNPKGWKVVTYKDMEEGNTEEKEIQEEEVKERPKEKRPLIWGDLNSRAFWKRNIFPVFLEAAFLILLFKNPNDILYINFFFYFVLFCYYLITKSFTFRNLIRNFKSGGHFWRATGVCSLLFAFTLILTFVLGIIFPNLYSGFFAPRMGDHLSIVIFAVTTMFLAPIVEEVFYRGNMINLESKSFRAISTVASLLLYAIIHSFSWWGIVSVIIWGIPFTLVFIKTRNVYITMTAHLIISILTCIPIIIAVI